MEEQSLGVTAQLKELTLSQHTDGFSGSSPLNPHPLKASGAWKQQISRSTAGHFIRNLAAVSPFDRYLRADDEAGHDVAFI